MAKVKIRETDLYAPVKSMLEAQGYEVKGEIGAADVVAVRGDEEPVIVEMKAGFSLALFHQAVERLSVSDAVYVAVPRLTGRSFLAALRRNRKLCRRLGLGLITVRLRDGHTEIHIDPGPYQPRKVPRRTARLLREFARLEGDPNTGGSTRNGLITAYRQDALRCLILLDENGPTKAAKVAEGSGVSGARRLMADNHYGWFERVATGIYTMSPNGIRALDEYAGEICRIRMAHRPDAALQADAENRAV
ncbi:DUF2161 domain-containing phosphodiesterase [Hoeflea prorocentri]|uniref:DUF2161 family putative PD-(D/E)XK-type phosphodiesterase n=1 Tax=Hoeflea prorocentri TaxID=1922333 RepID=A0A9X3ZII3_9HYPH|nr:DUF2161 family putative PD-(D/E)XK-type phosphodiesterase [Hoeflea prorocentri]MCY6382947.1 DUF2161 family putative PD-(D/E)XK-type phosphodiesterase [Hoeflea prorocentri]MDA5400747.1 DUF2161 family putative PD-(D/E)XK-type phosphodiesterase [Hoeflea prorocentri]